MNLDDVREVLSLVREHDLAELEIERDGLKIRVRRTDRHASDHAPAASGAGVATPTPVAVITPAATAAASGEQTNGVDLAVIKSPIVGTFYRASEPGARPFVEVGDPVRKGQVLCIIEAMKLMNEIESDCEGEIAAIHIDNGRPVQFGERLFSVKVK